MNFGKFWKCGFYDYRIVSITAPGKIEPCESAQRKMAQPSYDYYDEDETILPSLAQGRFIVHAKGVRDHIFHEVQVDYQDAEYDKTNQAFIRRGSFRDVENSLDMYQK